MSKTKTNAANAAATATNANPATATAEQFEVRQGYAGVSVNGEPTDYVAVVITEEVYTALYSRIDEAAKALLDGEGGNPDFDGAQECLNILRAIGQPMQEADIAKMRAAVLD